MPLPRLLLALAAAGLLLLAPSALAVDVPRQMTFQGRLLRADGSAETSPQNLRFALYTAATGGAPLWEEGHPNVPVTNGYYAVVLGASLPLPPAAVNGQALYLGVSLVGQSELTPRLPIVSVPYALRADDSNRLEGRTAASFADANHPHPNLPSSYGPGLVFTPPNGALSVAFASAGGTNGASTAAARADHTHRVTCTYRTATGNTDNGRNSTAWCLTTETLTGGGCVNLGETAPDAGVAFGPTGVTTVDSPNPTGGHGYVCRNTGAVSAPTPTAHAICCRNVP
jgi:hypothetical protein